MQSLPRYIQKLSILKRHRESSFMQAVRKMIVCVVALQLSSAFVLEIKGEDSKGWLAEMKISL